MKKINRPKDRWDNILDIFLWTDFEKCTVNDDIKKTVDYSKLVQILKDQSKKIYCLQSKNIQKQF